MADAVTTVTITHGRGEVVASVVDRIIRPDADSTVAAVRQELGRILGGVRGGRIGVRVDGSTAIAATGSSTCVFASLVAGDKFLITLPGNPTTVLTAVSTDAAVTASPYSGLYSLEGGTNTTVGASLAAAINNHTLLRKYLSASADTGTVTITALRLGVWGNGIVLAKQLGTAAGHIQTQFSGGVEHGTRTSETVILDQAKLTANDTISIGATTLTWKASASGESQVTIGGSNTIAGDNLVAKINAHSMLSGLVLASNASGTVTITWLGDPRTGELITTAKSEATPDAMTWSATSFTSPATESAGSATVVYGLGQAA